MKSVMVRGNSCSAASWARTGNDIRARAQVAMASFFIRYLQCFLLSLQQAAGYKQLAAAAVPEASLRWAERCRLVFADAGMIWGNPCSGGGAGTGASASNAAKVVRD